MNEPAGCSLTGLPVSHFHHFIRFPLLRRPLLVNIPFSVASVEEINPAPHIHEQNGYDKLRTNGYDIAYTFTHNNITLEHNAMNNKNTIAHMDVSQHAVLSTLRAAHSCTLVSHRTSWLKSASYASSHPMHVHLCLALWLFSPRLSFVLYFVPPFSFQPFLMFTSALNERSRSNPLCDFRLGTRGHIRLRDTPHRL